MRKITTILLLVGLFSLAMAGSTCKRPVSAETEAVLAQTELCPGIGLAGTWTSSCDINGASCQAQEPGGPLILSAPCSISSESATLDLSLCDARDVNGNIYVSSNNGSLFCGECAANRVCVGPSNKPTSGSCASLNQEITGSWATQYCDAESAICVGTTLSASCYQYQTGDMVNWTVDLNNCLQQGLVDASGKVYLSNNNGFLSCGECAAIGDCKILTEEDLYYGPIN